MGSRKAVVIRNRGVVVVQRLLESYVAAIWTCVSGRYKAVGCSSGVVIKRGSMHCKTAVS